MDWSDIQNISNALLAEGVCRLSRSSPVSPAEVHETFPGNYLVSEATTPRYIGEASVISARVKTQFDERRSTFYKNYLRFTTVDAIAISEFKLRFIRTEIGRKEIEDFGIANLRTPLNKFQIGKRQICPPAEDHAKWDAVQDRASELVKFGAAQCLEQRFHQWRDGKSQSTAGLYLIRNSAGTIIYVGESSDIFARFQTHSSRTYFSAVRRNLGSDILGYHLQTRKGKKRYFEDSEDLSVSEYLRECSIAFCPVALGRYEVEEHLIEKLRPILNRKSKMRLQ